MTYIVSSGTLNPTIPYHTIIIKNCLTSFSLPFSELSLVGLALDLVD